MLDIFLDRWVRSCDFGDISWHVPQSVCQQLHHDINMFVSIYLIAVTICQGKSKGFLIAYKQENFDVLSALEWCL